MPETTCAACGGRFAWLWEAAFDKFGFCDGDGQVMTATVALALMQSGYSVTTDKWGVHNTIITSITRHGIEQIPSTTRLGYDDPRDYLPADIITLLDAKLPEHGEARP